MFSVNVHLKPGLVPKITYVLCTTEHPTFCKFFIFINFLFSGPHIKYRPNKNPLGYGVPFAKESFFDMHKMFSELLISHVYIIRTINFISIAPLIDRVEGPSFNGIRKSFVWSSRLQIFLFWRTGFFHLLVLCRNDLRNSRIKNNLGIIGINQFFSQDCDIIFHNLHYWLDQGLKGVVLNRTYSPFYMERLLLFLRQGGGH